MTSDSKGYLISGKTVRGLAENERQRRGYLSPLPKMTRRRYDNGTQLEPYIVSQKQTNPLLGLGSNCAVSKRTGIQGSFAPETYFLAKPYVRGYTNLEDMPGDEVKVYTRGISGAIGTGQLFWMSPQLGEGSPTGDEIVGDVVQSPNGYVWLGLWRDGTNATAYCDVAYIPDVPMFNSYRTDANASGGIGGVHAFRVQASNATGETLFDGQGVTLIYTEFGWRVIDYTCRGA